MKIICPMAVRNEEWVLGLSARAVLRWCDELVILNHASTDRTEEIIRELQSEFPGRVGALADPDPVWHEMANHQWLLEAARERGATHIALVDADEILTGNLLPHIRGIFDAARRPGTIVTLPWLCLKDGISRVHSSGPWGSAEVSVGFQDDPRFYWKAQGDDAYDFHHRNPMGIEYRKMAPIMDRKSGMIHLQFASDRRLRAKQALYVCTEVLRWPGRKMADYAGTVYGHANARTSDPVLSEWLAEYTDLLQYLDVSSEPWQERAVLNLITLHGREKFPQDLFGVA
jgi:hypothetical protein